MLVKSSKDWKKFLNPEDEEKLNQMLKRTAKHRTAYRSADDVKVAQLWAALLELRKENEILRGKLTDMEDIFEFVYTKMKMKREEKEELMKSLEKF